MEKNNFREEVEIDIKQIFFVLVDKLVIIILVGVLAALLAFTYTKFMVEPVYQTKTQIYVYVENSTNSTSSTSDIGVATYLSSDYAEIIKTTPVYEEVIENLGLSMSAGSLGSMISVSTIDDTRQIIIYVNSTDPYLAQEIANEVREVAATRMEEIMAESGVSVSTVYEASLPTSPVSPNVTKNTAIGFLAGIVLAVLVIIVKFLLDDTIKSPDDVERYLGISVLATIPLQEDEAAKKNKKKKKKKRKKE